MVSINTYYEDVFIDTGVVSPDETFFRESRTHMQISRSGVAVAITLLTGILIVVCDIVLWLHQTNAMEVGAVYASSLLALASIGVLWLIMIPIIHWKWTLGYLICGLLHIGLYLKIITDTAPGDFGPLLIAFHWYVWLLMVAGGLLSWGISAMVKFLTRLVFYRRTTPDDRAVVQSEIDEKINPMQAAALSEKNNSNAAALELMD